MTTDTEICNIALGWLGSSRITSLTTPEDTKEWLLCSENYDPLRKAVLEEREWTFAVTRVIILPDPEAVVFGSETRFRKPPDSVRILTVHDSAVQRPQPTTTPTVTNRGVHEIPQLDGWQAEGNYIIGNADKIYVRYNKEVSATGVFSAQFIQVLAQRMAAEFALPLTESRSLYDKMWNAYHVKISQGAVTDGMQGRSRRVRSQALIRRR